MGAVGGREWDVEGEWDVGRGGKEWDMEGEWDVGGVGGRSGMCACKYVRPLPLIYWD